MGRKRAFGFFLIFLGIFLVLNSAQGITGFAIAEEVSGSLWRIVGMFLVVVGVVIGMAKELPVRSERGIQLLVTDDFKRAIRRHPKEPIIRALKNIGTGIGHEEPKLKGYDIGSIRAGEGERVLFRYNEDKSSAEVLEYTPDHDYEKVLRKYARKSS